MGNFCPFIKDYCRSDCVFRTSSNSTTTTCRIDSAAVNLEYIGNIYAAKSDEEEDLAFENNQ